MFLALLPCDPGRLRPSSFLVLYLKTNMAAALPLDPVAQRLHEGTERSATNDRQP